MDVYKGIRKMEDLLLDGRRVLIRVDYSVPLTPDGEIADDSRIEASLPTLRYAIEQGAKVVLASHLGKPRGKRVPELSMVTVGERLRELLARELEREFEIFLPDECVGEGPRKVVMERVEGEVVLLENLGYYPEEEANDNVFAQRLAALADVFVNDAFGSSGRPVASLTAARHFTEKGVGLLMAKELAFLSRIAGVPDQPLVVLQGGGRFSEKLAVLNGLLGKVKTIVLGGAVATTCLAARGLAVGRSKHEADRVEAAQNLMSRAKLRGVDCVLPLDAVVRRGDGEDAPTEVVRVESIPEDGAIVDIGPETAAAYATVLKGARTVFWNGPMGVWEQKPFLAGTEAVAKAIARSSAVSVVAGGDTAAAVGRLVLTPFFRHVSTGGSSALTFLEGRDLPGLEAMREAT
jgi:phosphoglycerate kinase